jgi:hypothetical protein
MQGFAQLAQVLASQAINRRADRDETKAEQARVKALMEALSPNVSTEPATVGGQVVEPLEITARDPVLPSEMARIQQQVGNVAAPLPSEIQDIRNRIGDPAQLEGFPEQQAMLQSAIDAEVSALQQRFPEQRALQQQAVDQQIAAARPDPRVVGTTEQIMDRIETPKTPNQLIQAMARTNPLLAERIVGELIVDRAKGTAAGTTDDIKEYRFAREQGYPGSLQDWIDRNKGRGTDGAPAGWRWTKDGNLEFIKDGPADPAYKARIQATTPEAAAKTAMIVSARQSSEAFKRMLYDKEGKLQRGLIVSMNTPGGGFPFSQGRSANVLIKDAIEAKLRAESGAAVPTTEVERAAERFRPSITDSPETVALKLQLLDRFLNDSFNILNKDGRFDVVATVDNLLQADLQVSTQVSSQQVDSQYKIGDEAEDGQGRTIVYTKDGWVYQ